MVAKFLILTFDFIVFITKILLEQDHLALSLLSTSQFMCTIHYKHTVLAINLQVF